MGPQRPFAVLAALVLALGWAATSHTQERFYPVRADPSSADANVATHPNALVGEDPFWLKAETLINQPGLCRAAEYEGPDRLTSVNFTEIYQALAVAGFSDALPWFADQGLYPFGQIRLDVADPRAPGGYPIFCAGVPAFDEDTLQGELRPLFFDFDADTQNNGAYVFARMNAPQDDQRDMRRIILGAYLALAELWDYGRRAELGVYDLGPPWLHTASYDALAITAADAHGRTFFDAYDDVEQRLPFLQGAYHQRLMRPSSLRDETSSGAFIRFLMEYHVRDGWRTLDPLLGTAQVADDVMGDIDAFIDTQDEELRGLEHAFPAFVAYQASLGYRYENETLTLERWLNDNFGDCQDARVSETSPSVSQTLTIEPYAARCLILRFDADAAPWHGDAHMRTQIAGLDPADTRNNRVFVSSAGTGEGPINGGLQSGCFTNVEQDGDGRSCIYEPSTQGRNQDRQFQRYYHFEIGERTPSDEQWRIILVSYVPQRGQNAGAADFPPVDVEFTLAVDAVIGGEGGLADMGPSSASEFELFDVTTASLNHGSKVGLAPITARRSGTATDRDSILDGVANPVEGGLLELGMAAADTLLQFVDDAGDGFSVMLGDPGILDSGFTGPTTNFTGVVSKDGYIGIVDPDFEGRIEIIENTPDTLHFTAEEGFCMLPQDQYLELIQQTNGDICEAGQRITARGEGALAFPPTRRSETKLEPVETEEFRALRNFRIERINERLGLAGMTGPDPAGPPGGPTRGPVSNPGQPTSPAGEEPAFGAARLCPVRDSGNQCSCTCEARACLQTRMESGTATPQERSCRLTCGRAWMQCPSP